jgi:hypothetical protein
MRETLLGTRELAKKLAALEKKLGSRLDVHEAAIVQVFARDHANPEPAASAAGAGTTQNRLSPILIRTCRRSLMTNH